MNELRQAAILSAEEFKRRTRAIVEDPKADMMWQLPEYRVCWSEVIAHFCISDRCAFQCLFEEEIKKRKLFRVLRGKSTAQEWVEKYGHSNNQTT